MKIVLALGGNALQKDSTDKSAEGQLQACRQTAASVADLIEDGHEVSIVHGNGPQVGQILASLELAHQIDDKNPLFPFDVVDAFSEGYIGYHLQNTIREELLKRGIKKSVDTITTQVIVNKDDPGFKNPTKPIGSFYSKEEAERLEKENGYVMKEDAGRGYRRVVASPKPLDIVEKDAIKTMVENDFIVIACGGGGIPVIEEGDSLIGVPAVIDKDFAAEKLAEILDADALLILTAVDRVCVNFNKPNQEALKEINLQKVDRYIEEGQFAPGSMLPKVEACKKFVLSGDDKVAIIASLSNARDALRGESGTKIVK
ncbi:carbamate kinase [Clostridium sp. LIBA-8841]|uniref:carbamate kinase n=1 Tax=Clostridium sp. LIBA-8841 TaxID=2987530 RepID=UPI002AC45F96|nr:carbamate kinase [Clostridium sp. LIBA-8841]MDZ5255201.1 carbamate kinase [Clostridium sp. LIBA-8841]